MKVLCLGCGEDKGILTGVCDDCWAEIEEEEAAYDDF